MHTFRPVKCAADTTPDPGCTQGYCLPFLYLLAKRERSFTVMEFQHVTFIKWFKRFQHQCPLFLRNYLCGRRTKMIWPIH